MAWFKVDDGFWSHPKTLQISSDAIALWVRAGAWSCQQLTDGFIADAVFPMFGLPVAAAEELVEVGYWHRRDGGYTFHDWDEYQEASEKVKARRAAARERMRAVRANKERTVSERAQDVRGQFANSSPNPDPTRPDPTQIDITNVSASLTLVDARANEIDEEVSSWAKAAGIRDFLNLRRIVAGELGVSPDDAALIDAVKNVCRQAKAPVLDVDGYFVAAVRRTPHTVYAALGLSEADAVEARAAVAELLARGGA